jgi:hypothetical protein
MQSGRGFTWGAGLDASGAQGTTALRDGGGQLQVLHQPARSAARSPAACSRSARPPLGRVLGVCLPHDNLFPSSSLGVPMQWEKNNK